MNNGGSKQINEDYNQFLTNATCFSLNFISNLHFEHDNSNLNLSIINSSNVYYDIKKQTTKEFVHKEVDNFKYISSFVKMFSNNAKKVYTNKNKVDNEKDIENIIEINKDKNIQNKSNNSKNNINVSTKDNKNNNSRNTRKVVESTLNHLEESINPQYNTVATINTPMNSNKRQTVNNESIYSTNQSSLEPNYKKQYQKLNNKLKINSPNTTRISRSNERYIIPKTNLSFIEDHSINNNTIIINTDFIFKQIQLGNGECNTKRKGKQEHKGYIKPLIPKLMLPNNEKHKYSEYNNYNSYRKIEQKNIEEKQKINMLGNSFFKTFKSPEKSKYEYVLNFDNDHEIKQKSPSDKLNKSNEFSQNKNIQLNSNKKKKSENTGTKKKSKKVKKRNKDKEIFVTLNEKENDNKKENINEVLLNESERDEIKEQSQNMFYEENYIEKEIKTKKEKQIIVSFGDNPIQNQQFVNIETNPKTYFKNTPTYVDFDLEKGNLIRVQSQHQNLSSISTKTANNSKTNVLSHKQYDVFGGSTESQSDIFNIIDQNSGTLRFSFRPKTPTNASVKQQDFIINSPSQANQQISINFTPEKDGDSLHQPKKQNMSKKKHKKIQKEKNDLKKRLVFEPD